MSKRKLLALVEQDLVRGWNDPRMPTIAGLRRRGYTPEAVRDFCTRIGVAKKENVVDVALLEHTVREDLNRRAQRGLAVLRPLKVEIENYPEGQVEYVEAINNPGGRECRRSEDSVLAGALHRGRRLHEGPAQEVLPSFSGQRGPAALRLHPEVRARDHGRRRRAHRVQVHDRHRVAERRHRQHGGSRARFTGSRPRMPSMPKCGCTIGCSARRILAKAGAIRCDGSQPRVADGADRLQGGVDARRWSPGTRFQFERQGYFCVDPDSQPTAPVFNRTVTLKDTWAKISGKSGK